MHPEIISIPSRSHFSRGQLILLTPVTNPEVVTFQSPVLLSFSKGVYDLKYCLAELFNFAYNLTWLELSLGPLGTVGCEFGTAVRSLERKPCVLL